jgi:hypothetical protein
MAITSNISELIIRLKDEVSKEAGRVQKSLGGVDKQILALGSQTLKFGGIATGIAASLLAVAKSVADFHDAIGKAAERTGVGVENLAGLKFAADLADVSFEELQVGLTQFSARLQEVQRGSGEAKRAFDALGISVTDQQGNLKTTEELFLEVADRLSNLKDGHQKTAMAMDIFGRSGAALIPLLNAGSEALREQIEQGKKLSGVTEESAKRAQVFNDTMTALTTTLTGLWQTVAIKLLPPFQELFDLLARMGGISVPGIESRALERSIARIDRALEGVSQRLGKLGGTDPFFDRQRALLQIQLQGLQREREDLEEQFERIRSGETKPRGAAPPAITDPEAEKKAAEAMKRREEDNRIVTQGIFDQEEQLNKDLLALQEEREKQRKQEEDALANRFDQDLLEMAKFHEATREIMEKTEEEGKRLTESLRTAQEKYNDEVKRLGELLDATAISSETFFRGIRAAQEDLTNATEKTDDVARQLGLTFTSAFEDAVIEGKKFQDVLAGIFKDIARLVIRKTVTEPAAKGLSLLLKKIDIGSFVAGLFGFQTAPGQFKRVPGPPGREVPAIVHGGEVVGRPIMPAIIIQNFTNSKARVRRLSDREIIVAIGQSENRAVMRSVYEVRERKLRGGNFTNTFDR